MNTSEILSKVDHTLLSVTATWGEIKGIIDDGISYKTANVCIPPAFVHSAAAYSAGRVAICTVIGFPNGYATTAAKVYEAWDAVKNGADEVDMVINLGLAKEGKWEEIKKEIDAVKQAVGTKCLKVIVESCLLTQEELCKACRAVSLSTADFIKTSTGFQKEGATFEVVELMKANCTKKVKAAGGISSMEDAQRFLQLGAERLGTSRIVKLVKAEGEGGQEGAY